MNFGQGAFGFVNNQTGGGGGGTVIGARNGTSDVANFIELGGNDLIHDTTFDTQGFDLSITQQGGFPGLDIDPFLGGTLLEGTDGITEVRFILSGSTKNAQIEALGALFLNFDFNNDRYQYGDISGIFNKCLVDLDDANNSYSIALANEQILAFSRGTRIYEYGDLQNLFNGMKVHLEDNAYTVVHTNTDKRMLALTPGTGFYHMGDLDNFNNATEITVDDTNKQILFGAFGGGDFLVAKDLGIETLKPTGGVSINRAFWQFGEEIAAVSTVDLTKYLEVNVDGTIYKIATFN